MTGPQFFDVGAGRDVLLSMPAGLLAWYKADSITTLADGDPVSTWTDSSGNGFTATQVGAARPIWKATLAPGGKPAIQATTLGMFLATAARVGNSLGTAVVVAAAPSNGAAAPSIAYDQGGKNRIVTYYDTNTKLFAGNNDDVLDQDSEGDLLRWVDGVPTGAGAYDIGNTNFHVVVEQAQDAAANTMSGTATRLMIGNATFLGLVAEILLFSSVLSAASRRDVETYLKGKYSSIQ